MINAGEWLVGPVNRVVVDAAHQVLEGVDVEDTVHLLARHGTVLGSYCLNQYQSPNENTLTVVCERGTIRCELHENRWRWMNKPGDPWHDEPIAPFERDALYIAQAERFLDAARGHRGCAVFPRRRPADAARQPGGPGQPGNRNLANASEPLIREIETDP